MSRNMSRRTRKTIPARFASQAPVFAALGDETRLALVVKLADGQPRSISHLTVGSRLTRQAITKHLGILKRAGMVRSRRMGRERRFEFKPAPVNEMREYLEFVSRYWDQALGRLKSLVEN